MLFRSPSKFNVTSFLLSAYTLFIAVGNSMLTSVYDLLKKNQMEAVIVDYWKRIPKDSFRNWYKSQSRYRTKEDREKDALLEDATITMEQRDLERSMQ